jgi:H/ACA ribonucleoprotein complex non-core subunit NAF1
MITSDSSGENEGDSEEGDASTSETDSDESDTSDSDSDSTSSSEAGSNLPMEGSGGSDAEASRLRTQHKKNKAKLDRMVHDDTGSEDGLDAPTGIQASSMFATVHEIVAPQVTMPSITEIPDDEPIELLGEVANIVDSVVVVKSLSNGMQRVLDTDSMLVLENRKVLGFVSAVLFGGMKRFLMTHYSLFAGV